MNDSWEKILNGEDVRTALSELRIELRDQGKLTLFLDQISEQEVASILLLLRHEDPKVRKNAAALIGDLGIPEAADALYLAYENEETRFVRSTYLSALEKTGVSDHLPQIREQYQNLAGQEPAENEKKHFQEELRSLEKLIRSQEDKKRHTFCGYEEKQIILLTTAPGFQEVTAGQIHARKKAISPLGVRVIVDDIKTVLPLHIYREILFPIQCTKSLDGSMTPEELGEALADSNLMTLLTTCHVEEPPFYFRMEIRNGMTLEERSQFIKKLSFAIENGTGRQLLNSAGEYEVEIRLVMDKEEKFHPFLKMHTIPNERFAYRKNVISSSIHPYTAALIVELSKPFLKPDAQVLDPFCGVGTMLIERNQKLRARELCGIDIFGEAIEFARDNTKRAGVSANYIMRDFFDFRHNNLFDEVITNMPVRGRKTKEEMDAFYQNFFAKVKNLLNPGGVIILYSNEEGFVKKQMRLRREFILLKEYMISRKDHHMLYIIGLREN